MDSTLRRVNPLKHGMSDGRCDRLIVDSILRKQAANCHRWQQRAKHDKRIIIIGSLIALCDVRELVDISTRQQGLQRSVCRVDQLYLARWAALDGRTIEEVPELNELWRPVLSLDLKVVRSVRISLRYDNLKPEDMFSSAQPESRPRIECTRVASTVRHGPKRCSAVGVQHFNR
jgi:hypothetical protein